MTWIKFANLCRKSDRTFLAEKTLNSLMSPDRVSDLSLYCLPSLLTRWQLHLHYRDENIIKPRVPPHVVYAHLKFLWSSKRHDESLKFLFRFTHGLAKDVVPEVDLSIPGNKQKLDELSRLLARCYFKQGQWQVALHKDWDTVSLLPIARHVV